MTKIRSQRGDPDEDADAAVGSAAAASGLHQKDVVDMG